MIGWRKTIAVFLALAMLLSLLPAASAGEQVPAPAEIPAGREEAPESAVPEGTGSPGDSGTVQAIVFLEDAPAAVTAPRGSREAALCRARVINRQNAVLRSMEGIPHRLQYRYDTLVNGFCCEVARSDLEKIAALDGVASVHIANWYSVPEVKEEPAVRMPSANTMMGNDTLWAAGNRGEGMVIAVLDTGLLTTHEAFQDAGGICEKHAVLDNYAHYQANCMGSYVSPKIPFAWDYADSDDDVTDLNGHGTHVAGICAGWAAEVNEAEGTVNCTFSGAAPAAQILAMKVFYDHSSGTNDGVIFQALEDAYLVGADVINLSLGSSNGFTYDPNLENVYHNIYKHLSDNGVILSVSAGNDGSMADHSASGSMDPKYMDYGTVGSPATYEGCTSVASMENQQIKTHVMVAEGSPLTYQDSAMEEKDRWLTSFGGKTADYTVLLRKDGEIALGTAEDYRNADVSGKVVVISRGENTFEEKVELAAKAGATGCIILNTEADSMGMSIETYEIPAVSMDSGAREVFLAAPAGKLECPRDIINMDNPLAGTISSFSSWGPSPDLTIDPAITGVGGKVYSACCSGSRDYKVYSGTSMAAPSLSGTYALVLCALRQISPYIGKQYLGPAARDAVLSSALILSEGDSLYSVRRQGAGLASAALAAKTLKNGAYIEAPLKELKDDPGKTGVYSYDVTLAGNPDRDAEYSEIKTFVQTDRLATVTGKDQKPVVSNTLTELPLEDSCKISYTVNGTPVTGVTVPAGRKVTVHVEIRLSEELKQKLDRDYPRGTYIEGFTEFYQKGSGETVSRIHATFLAFYGDWTAAPALEETDFRDFLEKFYEVSQTAGSESLPEQDAAALEPLQCCALPNLARNYHTRTGESISLLGENCLVPVPFDARHIAISGSYSDCVTNGLILFPYFRRNAVKTVVTFSDRDQGTVYCQFEPEYVSKSFYSLENPDASGWQTDVSCGWNGSDQNGDPLPDGTVVTVTVDAELPYHSAEQKNLWSFDVMIDSVQPEITADYNKDTKELTVTAKDNQFLQGVVVCEGSEVLHKAAAEQKNAGEEFTAVFPMKGTELNITVWALDYATNTASFSVPFFSERTESSFTFYTPGTPVEYGEYRGFEMPLPDCSYEVDGYVFDSWVDAPVEHLSPEEYADTATHGEGKFIRVTESRDFYALYARGERTDLKIPRYDLLREFYGTEIALAGFPRDGQGNPDLENPFVLGKNGEAIKIREQPGADVRPEASQFDTDAGGICYTIGYVEWYDRNYTFCNEETGKYLSISDGKLVLQDCCNSSSVWKLQRRSPDDPYLLIYSYAAPNLLLAFDDRTGCFALMDDTVPLGTDADGQPVYPHSACALALYHRADYVCDAEYYTTNPREDSVTPDPPDPSDPTRPEVPVCHVKDFRDCDSRAWYHEPVDYMAHSGLMGGIGQGLFGPQDPLTRAMMVTVLYRAAGSPPVDGLSDFTDVPAEQWYAEAVAWAQKNKIVNGVGEGRFAPDDNVTREDIATILWRAEGEKEAAADLEKFSDADKIMCYARKAVAWAVEQKILGGDNGSLKPVDFATRAEFAAMFMRYRGGSYACPNLP